MTQYEILQTELLKQPKRWLVTGAAGFIGSNLVEQLLKLNQNVVGLDNFSTGHQYNVDDVLSGLTKEQAARFRFVAGDITDFNTCRTSCEGVDYVLHQAALGSVPRSIKDPIASNHSNVDGFLNIITAARDAGVKRFVYASSSSVYGDHPDLPKLEEKVGKPLSPYAVTKAVNELYAEVFGRTYGMEIIGFRYFNVFGRRQDPNGAYAAVIPKWFASIIKNEPVYINGDGETSRDFCYIDNVVQANLLAACTSNKDAIGQVYNIAYGQRTTLNQLYELIRERVAKAKLTVQCTDPIYREFRPGDVRHSLADISKAVNLLGYAPSHSVLRGLDEAAEWYLNNI